jgi:low temperature requirement protein LtrA
MVNSYQFLKLLHELAAFWFIAGILGRQLARRQARRSTDIAAFTTLTGLAGRFESLMVIPGNLLVIVAGIVTAIIGRWPLFGFLQGAEANWLLVANLILLGGLLLVPLVYVPRGKKFDQALQAAQTAGAITPQLTTTLNDPVVKFAHLGEYLGLFVIIVLMVLKPF